MKFIKKGVVSSEVTWWIIGLILLAIVIAGIIIIKVGGFNLMDKIGTILRFGK